MKLNAFFSLAGWRYECRGKGKRKFHVENLGLNLGLNAVVRWIMLRKIENGGNFVRRSRLSRYQFNLLIFPLFK